MCRQEVGLRTYPNDTVGPLEGCECRVWNQCYSLRANMGDLSNVLRGIKGSFEYVSKGKDMISFYDPPNDHCAEILIYLNTRKNNFF